MDEHQSFLEDDDDDTLLFEKLQEHVLEAHPNPERIGCFDNATLKAWVLTPEKLDLSDPKYLHVLKCAECTRELIELRKLRNAQSEYANVGSSASAGHLNELAMGGIRVGSSLLRGCGWGDLLADAFAEFANPSCPVSPGGCDDRSQPRRHDQGY